MDNTRALMQVVDNPGIDQIAEPLSKAVRGAYEAAGPVGQRAKNALHGVWLGHPLHPVFTDLPLSEGTLKEGSVVCPWHGSEFALDDGRVLNGPATHNQPCLVARERNGRVEVKVAPLPGDDAAV